MKKTAFFHYFNLIIQVGLTIVVCVLVGLGIGLLLDKLFKTQAIFSVIFLIFGVIAGFKVVYEDILKRIKKDE